MLAFRGRFLEIVIIYGVAMALALFFAWPPPQEVPPSGENPATAGAFLGYVLLATAVFLAIIKRWPWILHYVLAILEILFLLASVAVIVASYRLPPTLPYLAVLARIIWWRSRTVQNISTLTIISVTTAIVGESVSPTVGALILATFAIYDYVAVFVTKHMVTLARALGAAARKDGSVEEAGEEHMLGAGDVAIPGIFAVSLLRVGMIPAIMAATGAVIGLYLTVILARRWKRVLPALPSIALPEFLFSIIGLILLSL